MYVVLLLSLFELVCLFCNNKRNTSKQLNSEPYFYAFGTLNKQIFSVTAYISVAACFRFVLHTVPAIVRLWVCVVNACVRERNIKIEIFSPRLFVISNNNAQHQVKV